MAPIDEKKFKQRISADDGKVGIYFPKEKRMRRVMPIDARDHLTSGEGLLGEPLVALTGKAGPITVKHSQQDKYLKDGYTVVENIDSEDLKEDATKEDDDKVTPATYSWEEHTIPELRGFADAANIAVQNGANKNTIVEQLKAANYLPDGANG